MKVRLVVLPMLLVVSLARAQAPSAGDGVRDLLDRARAALNDLSFTRSDSLAREVLTLGARLRRADRIEALQIVAVANYPEGATDRKEAQARSAIAELLRVDMGAMVPRDISWAGLDSLYREVARTTFAISVLVRRDNPIVGVDAASQIRVRSSQPARWTMAARSRDGIESVFIDSVSQATDTTLRLVVARDRKPFLRGGEYEIVVTATNLRTEETVVRRYDAITIVPSIDYVVVPARIDSSRLLPERSKGQRLPIIIGGVLLGASTIVMGKQVRAKEPVKADGENDKRYTGLAVAMTAAAVAAGWFDRGRILDKNRAANQRAKQEFERSRTTAMVENQRRATEYRASITLNTEAR